MDIWCKAFAVPFAELCWGIIPKLYNNLAQWHELKHFV